MIKRIHQFSEFKKRVLNDNKPGTIFGHYKVQAHINHGKLKASIRHRYIFVNGVLDPNITIS